jgi:DNA (cytosine-5)-methyltransferase 1
MRHGSLFSGIGGFDLAAEWMGWENVFHCEWMEFPRKVLDYYFPNADSHIDICKTDFKKYANTIDILTGGFPCQPFSMAGKRKGTDDERYLWGEMLRAIQEIKPKYVIAENVFGITNIDGGLVFEQVCLDLEAEGYEVQPFIIPAAAKNAPHRRDRVWFVAYANGTGEKHNGGTNIAEEREVRWNEKGNVLGELCGDGNATDTQFERLEGHNRERERCTEHRSDEGLFIGAETEFDATYTTSTGGGQDNRIRKSRLNNQTSKRNDWSDFPTQPPICSGDDGLPSQLDGITFSKWRAESIKGYGNAIVPQVAYEIFKQL